MSFYGFLFVKVAIMENYFNKKGGMGVLLDFVSVEVVYPET